MQRNLDVDVRVVELDSTDVRPDLVELRRRKVSNFIVDVGKRLIPRFFDQAMKAGIVRQDAAFIATDMDFVLTDLYHVTETGADIFGLSAVNRDKVERLTTAELSDSILSRGFEAAVLYDGMNLLTHAVAALANKTDLASPDVKCADRDAPYDLGQDLLNAIRQVL